MNRPTLVLLATVTITSTSALTSDALGQSYGNQPYARPPGDTGQAVPRTSAPTAGSVEIRSPKDGAAVPAGTPVIVDYAVDPGPQGDHVHFYVNGKEVAVVRRLVGQHRVEALPAGSHEVAIKVVNSAHVPIGIESAITLHAR